MISTNKQNHMFYTLLITFSLFACLSDLSIVFQVLLYPILIIAPLLFDDTKAISAYFYTACFMACFGENGFLAALNVSLLILEIKKFVLATKNKENTKSIKKVFIVWITILSALTMYSLIYNNFKVYRMGMFIDLIQCCVACYLVRKNIDIKHILLLLFAGIIASVATASVFSLADINNRFIAGSMFDRFGAFLNNVNTLSVYCTLCASGFIVLILTNKLDFNHYFYFPTIITAVGLLTYSKAFILINILLYCTWFALSVAKADNKKRFIVYLFALIIGIGLVSLLAKSYIEAIVDRFVNTQYSSVIDNFTTGRIAIWKKYLKRWLKSPLTFLFGNGYTASKIATKQYEHSIYVALLHQFGVIGSAIVIGALIWTIHKNAKLQKNIACYIPLGLFLINGTVSNLSGVLCTCLIWFMALYFVTDTGVDNPQLTENSITDNTSKNDSNQT